MINVIPMNDEREHERATTCWCGPRIEFRDDKPAVMDYQQHVRSGEMLVIHNAADCREIVEQATGERLAPDKTWLVQPG